MRLSLIAPFLLLAGCSVWAPETSETRPMGVTSISKEALERAKVGPVSFTDHIRPILEAKCAMCHNRSALPGRMSLQNQQEATRTGAIGQFIMPGNPEQSLMANNLGAAHASIKAMPPVGQRVTSDEIFLLKKWIQEGADWPKGPDGEVDTSP